MLKVLIWEIIRLNTRSGLYYVVLCTCKNIESVFSLSNVKLITVMFPCLVTCVTNLNSSLCEERNVYFRMCFWTSGRFEKLVLFFLLLFSQNYIMFKAPLLSRKSQQLMDIICDFFFTCTLSLNEKVVFTRNFTRISA